ncbi:MAG: 4-hydroxythreonine-4-phosphate dehydrogenase PdxA [Deltaproteobacteria bacterium]|nr:4-hydroxythreonine-4-phosphate dehydrogenase PdxA [Deltaproteobacteria bacterium]
MPFRFAVLLKRPRKGHGRPGTFELPPSTLKGRLEGNVLPETSRPVLGLTLGDVAGVGPEVVVRALADESVFQVCQPLVLGDLGALERAVQLLDLDLAINVLEPTQEPAARHGAIDLLPLSRLDPRDLVPGHPSLEGGRAAARYIETGAKLALAGQTQGLVTAPISKVSLNRAGYHYQGHTEMLADLAGGMPVVMMLVGSSLRVALATTHIALKDVPGLLSAERIVTTARITDEALRQYFKLAHPRLAASALNPHASEGGLFGREEEEIIEPAVAQARKQGLDFSGPFPADTVFYRAVQGEFHAVICMYHDQALIPFKLLHFKDGVNVTLGLPFIRTSVDHGTAYDIAGQARADPASMLAALRLAARMAAGQKPRP